MKGENWETIVPLSLTVYWEIKHKNAWSLLRLDFHAFKTLVLFLKLYLIKMNVWWLLFFYWKPEKHFILIIVRPLVMYISFNGIIKRKSIFQCLPLLHPYHRPRGICSSTRGPMTVNRAEFRDRCQKSNGLIWCYRPF